MQLLGWKPKWRKKANDAERQVVKEVLVVKERFV